MANEFIAKDYTGGAVATTLAVNISGAVLSITVASGAGLLDGSGGPYVLTINRGQSTEEKVLVSSRAGNVLTILQRGYDGTAAVGHNSPEPIEHTLDANSIKQANILANRLTTKGDIFVRDAGATGLDVQRLAVGANDRRLVADSTQTLGLRYAPDTENKLIDAKGDLLVATAADTLARMAVGNNGSHLIADSASAGGVKWNTGALATWSSIVADQLTGLSFTTALAKYVRDGRFITCWFDLSFTNTGTIGNPLLIGGLPVNAIAAVIGVPVGVCEFYDTSAPNPRYWCYVQIETATQISLRLGNSGAPVENRIGMFSFAGAVAAGDRARGCFTYEATTD